MHINLTRELPTRGIVDTTRYSMAHAPTDEQASKMLRQIRITCEFDREMRWQIEDRTEGAA